MLPGQPTHSNSDCWDRELCGEVSNVLNPVARPPTLSMNWIPSPSCTTVKGSRLETITILCDEAFRAGIVLSRLATPLAGTRGSKYYENGQNEIGTRFGYSFSPWGLFYKRFFIFLWLYQWTVSGGLARIGYVKIFRVLTKSLDIPAKKKSASAYRGLGQLCGDLTGLLKSFLFNPFDQFIQGGVAENPTELGTIVIHDTYVFNHDIEDLPIGIHGMEL